MAENNQIHPADLQFSEESHHENSLLDIAIIFAKHKRLIVGLPLVAGIIAAGLTLLMPNVYTGRAVLMPPQQQQSTAALMLGQLSALTGMSSGSIGLKNPNDLYVGMLKSRSIADALIDQFRLQELYDQDTLVETRKILSDNTTLISGRDGLIVVEVDDEEPTRAAQMANAYVEQLAKLTKNLAITEASQRRLFFEEQLLKAKEGLTKAENELQKTQERTGLIALDEQGKALIESAALLRAQIAAKEVELTTMLTYATDSNPQYIRVRQELAGLRNQLARLERSSGRDEGDVLMSTGRIPAAGLEYVRRLRDIKYYEAIFELMAKQLELARIDESRDSAIIQVVDKAIPPDRKSKPFRALIVLAVVALFIFISMIISLVIELRDRIRSDPDRRESYEQLLVHLNSWRRK